MKPRVIYIHGNGAMNWAFAWSPWLKQKLEDLDYPTHFETFPDSIIAREEYWLRFLRDYLKAGENDVLVGWSSGAVAAMRYAETTKIRGSILVAPSYTDLGDDLEKQSGFFDTPWDFDKIKANQQNIALVYSDDDPYIPRDQFDFIAQKLSPTRYELSGLGHFIDSQNLPEVLEHIIKTYP